MGVLRVLSKNMYKIAKQGGSLTGNLVSIIGEQTIELTDGRIVEQFLYNIEGYTPENGLPFAALKANIIVFE